MMMLTPLVVERFKVKVMEMSAQHIVLYKLLK